MAHPQITCAHDCARLNVVPAGNEVRKLGEAGTRRYRYLLSRARHYRVTPNRNFPEVVRDGGFVVAKLIYSMLMSLDGYTEDAQGAFGWAAPDGEIHS